MAEYLSILKDDAIREYYSILCRRIADADGFLQVFVPETFKEKMVFEQVEALLARYPNTKDRPSLFGVPLGVKDIIHCDGFITRCGSQLPPELFQGSEADAVSRLKSAGAVVMGKTATTEFAYFAPAATRNPVKPAHTPGGSSSGSAAGVAAGFFEYALGTQTVGSVIRPAAYCGITGFKPTLGRVDACGVVPFSQTVDHVGVFGHNASTLSRVLAVLSDNWNSSVSLPDQIRLGVPVGAYLDQAEASTRSWFKGKVDRLEKGGYEIVSVPLLDDISDINEKHSRLIAWDIADVHSAWFDKHKDLYRSATKEIITTGMAVESHQLEDLRSSCLNLRRRISQAMVRERLNAWICPATTGEAPMGLSTTGSPLMNLPWTHAGVPAVTIPAGVGPGGLPLGLQIVGDFMADELLTALAAEIEYNLSK